MKFGTNEGARTGALVVSRCFAGTSQLPGLDSNQHPPVNRPPDRGT